MLLDGVASRLVAWLKLAANRKTTATSVHIAQAIFKNEIQKCSSTMLEPKCNDRAYAFPTLVFICNTLNKLTNIHISKVNDMFTPKPAKLDKHIYIEIQT